MPQLTGKEFLLRALKIGCQIRCAVMISGDTDIKRTARTLKDDYQSAGIPFLILRKPFELKDLLLFITNTVKQAVATE